MKLIKLIRAHDGERKVCLRVICEIDLSNDVFTSGGFMGDLVFNGGMSLVSIDRDICHKIVQNRQTRHVGW